jgi:ABC-type nitrate/sulfonate/bicarbonate transport system ATPase subunit
METVSGGLTVEIVQKRFGDRRVLGQVGFRLRPGERAALIGPSGIGKSTLIGILAGLDCDFEGRVTRPDGRVAVVFQTPRLLPWRTLAENIALIPGAGDLARARALLAEVGLGDAADLHPERVSVGMQRRAALARALAVEPSLLLLDEPLVSLDPDSASAMRELLRLAMDRTGAVALISTHDRREALALADRVLELGGQPARITGDRHSPLDRAARRDPAAVDALHAEWFEPFRHAVSPARQAGRDAWA